jgi:hypothetical protein
MTGLRASLYVTRVPIAWTVKPQPQGKLPFIMQHMLQRKRIYTGAGKVAHEVVVVPRDAGGQLGWERLRLLQRSDRRRVAQRGNLWVRLRKAFGVGREFGSRPWHQFLTPGCMEIPLSGYGARRVQFGCKARCRYLGWPREEENRLYPIHELRGVAFSLAVAGEQFAGSSRR